MADSAGSRSGRDLTGLLLDNRYRVKSKLGEGGMAAVYLASDERLDRPVVVKAPLEIFLTVSGFRERFAQEIHALIRLDHPFIGKILDRGEVAGMPFAVLQYLQGGSLMTRIEETGGRLTPQQISPWLPRVASALDFIHNRNFLHRDIKPGNILFDGEGNVYLADFGIAKVLGAKDFTKFTQTGTQPGTVAYMAPEAGGQEAPGPAYDQYALAVVVYQALAGDLPHELGESPISAMVQKIITDPVPLSQVSPQLPQGVCDAVMKALSTSPDARFESCAAFARAFGEGIGTAPARAFDDAATTVEGPSLVAEAATIAAEETIVTEGRDDEHAGDAPLHATAATPRAGPPATVPGPSRPATSSDRPTVVMPDKTARFDALASLPSPRWRLSEIRLPRIDPARIISRITLLQRGLPKLELAKLRPPKLGIPKLDLSRFARPRPGLPKLRLPRWNLQKLGPSQWSLPDVRWPKISLASLPLEPAARQRLFVGGGVVAAVVAVAAIAVVMTRANEPALPPDHEIAGRPQPLDAQISAPGGIPARAIGPLAGDAAAAENSAASQEQGGATEQQVDEPPAATMPTPSTESPETDIDPAPSGTDLQPEPGQATLEQPATPRAGEQAQPTTTDEPAAPAGETRAPQRISTVMPEYPGLPFALAIEGRVTVEATIDANGDVTGAVVVTGLHPMLDEAAIAAVEQWKYEPALRNGEARDSPLRATLDFTLPTRPDPGPVDDPELESSRQLDTIRFMGRVAAALESFRRANDAYPQALDQLGPFMQEVPTHDGWDTPFWYADMGEEYWLVSFGRDGAPGPAPPSSWSVGDAFEADVHLHAGRFDQAPEGAEDVLLEPQAAEQGAPAGAPVAAGIETVPITDEVTPPVLDAASVRFTLPRAIQDLIGLTARRISVRCLVMPDGSVAEARVLQVDPEVPIAAARRTFADSARRSAIESWRFRPAVKDGEPVAVWQLVHVLYQPQR